MSQLALYQPAHAELMFSQPASARSAPVRNGEPSRTHPVFYSPIIVSADALSKA